MTTTEPARAEPRFGITRLHRSGVDPERLLLIGDRGLLDLDGDSLASALADRMWLSTRHGVDLDVLSDLTPMLRAVRGAFAAWRLWRYDAVVIVIDTRVSLAARLSVRRHLRLLLEEVLRDAAGSTPVLVAAVEPSAAGRHGHPRQRAALHDALVAPVRIGRGRIAQTVLPDDVDTAATPWTSRGGAWADAIAHGLEGPLAATRSGGPSDARALREAPDDEVARQRALRELALEGHGRDPRLDDICELTRQMFGTQAAELNFIDRDRQWKLAAAGAELGSQPREQSFCRLTVQQASPTVIPDTRLDPRLAGNPHLVGPNAVRFYAAHPIESAEGYRIGSLCIYDSSPRAGDAVDLAALRDLALLAEAELIDPSGGVARRTA